jgi:5-methylthioadenosine/S-adenosylhomocysteine deaminase
MSLVVVDAVHEGAPVGIRLRDGLVAALGPEVTAEPDDTVIDAGGAVALPGMVNGHTHAAMTLFRSWGDDLPLMRWLQERIWPAEGHLTDDDVYWGTRLACLEMVRSGTTRFFDMYWFPEAVARAARDAGLRASVAAPLINVGTPDGLQGLRDTALGSLDALDGFDPRVEAYIAPHAIYTVDRDGLEWAGALRAERDVGVHMHLSETEGEVDRCVEEHGLRPAALLDACGLLGPRTLLAHGTWLDDDELALVAERGSTVVNVPVSNLKLATGRRAPYRMAAVPGVPLGLGTDGVASNNSLDLFQDVKVMALVHKFLADDPSVMPAGEALAVAQGRRSPLLGGSRLEVGAPADLVLVRVDGPELVPGDLEANLVYAATGAVVDTVVVAGEVLMQGREVPGADEVVARAAEAAARRRAVP